MTAKSYLVLGASIVALLVAIVVFAFVNSLHKYVDFGNTGILISAASQPGKPPNYQIIPTGATIWLTPFSNQQFVEYPTAVQQLVLASRDDEGELTGNSTIGCQMNGGGTLSLGLSVRWQVDPARPQVLYASKPNYPLVSSLNSDIATTLVYGAVSGDTLNVCSNYTWEQIIGTGTGTTSRSQLQKDIQSSIAHDLYADGILVSQVFIKEVIPSAQIQAVIDAENQAQKTAYLKISAQNQSDAQAITAQGNANAAVITAQGEAKSITLVNTALANSPQYIAYLKALTEQQIANKWDGKLPGTVVTSGGQNVILAPFGS